MMVDLTKGLMLALSRDAASWAQMRINRFNLCIQTSIKQF